MINLADYKDVLKKFESDFIDFKKQNHTYKLLDCIQSLNALPEWIKNDTALSGNLRKEAERIETIMKEGKWLFNQLKLDSDIKEKLRRIRKVCNHGKHNTKEIPVIKYKGENVFPITFPAKFDSFIAVGLKEINAENILTDVYNFWINVLKKHQAI